MINGGEEEKEEADDSKNLNKIHKWAGNGLGGDEEE